ncbi:MAG: hypothetical protein ABEJ06_02490 [Haloarculaceae archaeon]
MDSDRPRTVALLAGAAALLLAVSGLAAAAGPSATISADPATPDSTSTHTATEVLGNQTTGSWNGFKVGYTDADVSGVQQADIEKIGIDRGNDDGGTTIDVNVSDDVSSVSASNNGETMKVTLGGSYALDAGDQLVVVYGDVQNPGQTGEYDVSVDANPQSSGGEAMASLSISDSTQTTTQTTTDSTQTTADTTQTTADTTQTTAQTSETTTTRTTTAASAGGDDGSGGETSTNGSGPGFDLVVGTIAILGAALVALRQRD